MQNRISGVAGTGCKNVLEPGVDMRSCICMLRTVRLSGSKHCPVRVEAGWRRQGFV